MDFGWWWGGMHVIWECGESTLFFFLIEIDGESKQWIDVRVFSNRVLTFRLCFSLFSSSICADMCWSQHFWWVLLSSLSEFLHKIRLRWWWWFNRVIALIKLAGHWYIHLIYPSIFLSDYKFRLIQLQSMSNLEARWKLSVWGDSCNCHYKI